MVLWLLMVLTNLGWKVRFRDGFIVEELLVEEAGSSGQLAGTRFQ